MPSERRAFSYLLACLTALSAGPTVNAGTVYFSTRSTEVAEIPGHGQAPGAVIPAFTWNYSGNYADARRAVYRLNVPGFSNSMNDLATVCTSGRCGSNDFDGAQGAEYAGYEFIYFGFSLPANAVSVALHFVSVAADDRVAVDLNGHILGAWGGRSYTPPLTISTMLDGSGLHSAQFLGPTALNLSYNDPAWFNAGGENYIRFWINNTNSTNVGATARNHSGDGDPSALSTLGTIQYDAVTPSEIPEPSAGYLVLAGLLLLVLRLQGR